MTRTQIETSNRSHPGERSTAGRGAMLTSRLSGVLLAGLLALGLAPELAAQQTTQAEKDLRAEFKSAMRKKEPGIRASAVAAYSEGTRGLEDGGTSRLVAKTLAEALMDEDMSVAQSAVSALSWGRDPTTVVESYKKGLNEWRKLLGKTATRPDPESRALYRGALVAFEGAVDGLANYRDDRSVKVIEDELTKLRPGGVLENISGNLLGPMVTALTKLGSQGAVKAAVDTAAKFPAATFGGTSDREKSRLGFSRSIHDALSAFAVELETPPPAFDKNYEQSWSDWFKEHKKRLPKKLGKLETPPGPPENDMGAAARARANLGKPQRP